MYSKWVKSQNLPFSNRGSRPKSKQAPCICQKRKKHAPGRAPPHASRPRRPCAPPGSTMTPSSCGHAALIGGGGEGGREGGGGGGGSKGARRRRAHEPASGNFLGFVSVGR